MTQSKAIKNILLIENTLSDQYLIQEAFVKQGISHRLHIVQDGQQGLDFLYKKGKYIHAVSPDLIILDLNLPQISGYEFLRIVKFDSRLQAIPVVIFTVYTTDADALASYELKANCYINKPHDLEQFFTVVRKTIGFWCDLTVLPSISWKNKY